MSSEPAVETLYDQHLCPICGGLSGGRLSHCPSCGWDLEDDYRLHPNRTATYQDFLRYEVRLEHYRSLWQSQKDLRGRGGNGIRHRHHPARVRARSKLPPDFSKHFLF